MIPLRGKTGLGLTGLQRLQQEDGLILYSTLLLSLWTVTPYLLCYLALLMLGYVGNYYSLIKKAVIIEMPDNLSISRIEISPITRHGYVMLGPVLILVEIAMEQGCEIRLFRLR